MKNSTFLALAGVGLLLGVIALLIFFVRTNTITEDIETTPVPSPNEQISPNPTTSPVVSPSPTEGVAESMVVQVYGVILEGETEETTTETFGCGDTLVAIEREITADSQEDALEATLEELLSIEEQNLIINNTNVYNALANSNLTIDDVTITNGTAEIELSGQLQLGGVCDNPRVEQQLTQAALQFDSVNDVEITLDGEPLGEMLSGQG